MWGSLAKFVLKNSVALLIALFAATAFMAWQASKVQMSYEFAKSIPTDNPKFAAYQNFVKIFGDQSNTVVVGVADQNLLTSNFETYKKLHVDLKSLVGVEEVLSVVNAVALVKDSTGEHLLSNKIFDSGLPQDAAIQIFDNLPFYKGLMYNNDAWLMAVQVNKEIANSKARTAFMESILQKVKVYEEATKLEAHVSGLPFIRAEVAIRLEKEMRLFLLGSFLLSAVVLFLFFRSVSAMLLSLTVVLLGVVWSFGTLQLMGYKITLLTGIVPSLVVVIGVPNCIYFLNKFHVSWLEKQNKEAALHDMIAKMGVVTLFCNIAAAVGFAVFTVTKSPLLKEFGLVAGINIMLLFVISLIFIPSILKMIAPPKPQHLKYLQNNWINSGLLKVEHWAIHRKKAVALITTIVCIISILGIFRLKSVGYIVDDLPQKDKVFTDLKWFEQNFEGVMPLEISIDTKKKRGIYSPVSNLAKMDSLSAFITARNDMARPLSLVEALKFANQAFSEGDSSNYVVPSESELLFLKDYLSTKKDSTGTNKKKEGLNKLLNSYIDSNKQIARMSVNMKDVGSEKLPGILDTIQKRTNEIFDTAKYKVEFTGASVTFLEGSRFIINGLKESVIYAFLLIALCMLYLFRNFRILVCSLIPNVVPLLVTAGVMGWVGVPLKPSTVLIFSVALGISIDITIRFLVNYKQELGHFNNQTLPTITSTIRHTGLSIVYTSIVLIAGFIIFCLSSFGGTFALGWLTSLTLVVGTITNLILLPVIMLWVLKKN